METTTRTPERRIDSKIRRMQIGGALCAMFAAVGITTGIREMSPEIGWIVPILAGLCAAAGFAIIWHAMIGTIVGMIRLTMIVALFVVAAVVTTASWGISAQSIATAVAGRSAMSAELSAQVDTFNQTLAKAYAEATGWKGIAGSAAAKGAGFKLQADTEAGGSNGNGKGCGPIRAAAALLDRGYGKARQEVEMRQFNIARLTDEELEELERLTLLMLDADEAEATAH
jgi:hypothetical protein